MSKQNRQNHNPVFKVNVALASHKSDSTATELAKKFDVHPNQITQ